MSKDAPAHREHVRPSPSERRPQPERAHPHGSPRRRVVTVGVVSLLAIFLASPLSFSADSDPTPPPLVKQDPLDGEHCVPMYAVSLPVFGHAGEMPRVDAASHRELTVTMKENNQA